MIKKILTVVALGLASNLYAFNLPFLPNKTNQLNNKSHASKNHFSETKESLQPFSGFWKGQCTQFEETIPVKFNLSVGEGYIVFNDTMAYRMGIFESNVVSSSDGIAFSHIMWALDKKNQALLFKSVDLGEDFEEKKNEKLFEIEMDIGSLKLQDDKLIVHIDSTVDKEVAITDCIFDRSPSHRG